jgi:acid phosphatase (class A)
MKISVSLIALLLAASPALADGILSPADYPPTQILPAAPADGSAEQKKEMAELHHIQATMSNAEFAAANKDEVTENVTYLAPVLGPDFDFKSTPRTLALFEVVRAEEKAAGKLAKNTFKRHRPWVLDPSLKTCTRDDSPISSYPSGHSTLGFSMAVVMADMLPEKAGAIMARAKEFAEHRLVCGVHYRSDIVAGQVLGTLVAEELLHNPKFQDQFEAAKAELRAAVLGTRH